MNGRPDSKAKVGRLIVFSATSTMAAIGLLFSASASWVLGSSWVAPAVSVPCLLFALYGLATTYRSLIEVLTEPVAGVRGTPPIH